ncbi:hypothetical protein B0A54_17801 [Friedmanniomyces endolithicus]|uniref:Uncharacterized protein n=1 Tax=Friedmanniomyces endolithicus TaxID=329885 RepID=A0A4U0TUI8_9PEZI|nr:hypothetical protein B0A54_17801 [Friedmanniomyces endolithicus]
MSHFTPSKYCAVNARFSVLLHSVPADQRVMLVEAEAKTGIQSRSSTFPVITM